MPYRFILALFLVILFSQWGCGNAQIKPPRFDGQAGMKYLEKQVAFGPRVPGSQAWSVCRQYLVDHFKSNGLAVDSQKFSFFDPYSGSDKELVNIMASYRGGGKDAKALLPVAHWDSRPRADNSVDPLYTDSAIAGANDGASGVAVLMELARMFTEQGPESNVDFLLVDGEDWGKAGDNDLYLLGARYFAAQGFRDRYRFAIVIDMVGDSSQQIYREGYSERFAPSVNDYVFQTAEQLGLSALIDSVKYTMLDDHLALNSGGIPSIVLIDFDYPSWHTVDDTPDKCSAASLATVGTLLAYIVYNPSTWPEL